MPGRDKAKRLGRKGDCGDQFGKLMLGRETWLVMGYWTLIDVVDNTNHSSSSSSKTINEVSKHA